MVLMQKAFEIADSEKRMAFIFPHIFRKWLGKWAMTTSAAVRTKIQS